MNSTASATAAATATLELEYLSSDQVASRPASWWHTVLGIVGFAKPPAIDGTRVPISASMIPALGGRDLCEVWRLAGPQFQSSGAMARPSRVHYHYCDDLLFGSLVVAEEGAIDQAGGLMHATETAYREIFEVLNRTEHRHLIRIWNYLPDINRQAGGDERYRHFNSARQSAFRNAGRATAGTVPAACALGSPTGSPLSIYFLAARRPPKMIENPRQTSAYHYPRKFGRHAPTFSRACLWGEPANRNLFISGTASIVGHETMHRGDVVAQTRETLINIRALLDEANRVDGAARYCLDGLKYKVYVRRPADLPAIEDTLAGALHQPARIAYLQADICREDLLVEIEAVG
jgi:chorismate lyase / 3-hydroxybenzoate synthase